MAAAAPPRNNEKPCTGGPERCGRTAGRLGLRSFAFFSGRSSPSKMSIPAYSTPVSQVQGDFFRKAAMEQGLPGII
jgi:hypothetical protein